MIEKSERHVLKTHKIVKQREKRINTSRAAFSFGIGTVDRSLRLWDKGPVPLTHFMTGSGLGIVEGVRFRCFLVLLPVFLVRRLRRFLRK